MPHLSQSLGTCRTTAPEKLVAQHLSSCIQQFAIVMPGDARTKIDNARHAAGKADTTSGVRRNVAWSLPALRSGTCHVRVPRIVDETPGAPVV